MKNPLTSKERRGLVAVAAAALLCVSLGFFFRNCSSVKIGDERVIVKESVEDGDNRADGTNRQNKTDGADGANRTNKTKKAKKKKAEKVIPVRDPLSQPCD